MKNYNKQTNRTLFYKDELPVPERDCLCVRRFVLKWNYSTLSQTSSFEQFAYEQKSIFNLGSNLELLSSTRRLVEINWKAGVSKERFVSKVCNSLLKILRSRSLSLVIITYFRNQTLYTHTQREWREELFMNNSVSKRKFDFKHTH